MVRRKMFVARASLCVMAASLPLCALGCEDHGRSNSPPSPNQPNDWLAGPAARSDESDKTNLVLRQLHAANREEIELGKMAREKAESAAVQGFAEQMVADHTAADAKLMSLAERLHIDLAVTPTNPVERALGAASDESKRALRSSAPSSFDVAYFAPQVDKHTLALKLVDEAEKTATGDVKTWLDEVRPTVEEHLDHAKGVMRGLAFGRAIGGGPSGRELPPGGDAPSSASETGKHDGGRREAVPGKAMDERR
jgi:putative membrane protein